MSHSETPLMCRVCLNTDIKKYMSLFEKYKDSTINQYVLLLTKVVIKEDDGFPDRICSGCFLELENALNFKEKCENSAKFFQNNTDNILELCANTDDNTVLIVKKEEPLEADVDFASYDDYLNDNDIDLGAVDALDAEEKDTKPRVSRAIDLKLECHDCGSLFKSKCKLRVHWKKTHMLSSLICDICKRRFKSYKAYHCHKKNKLKSCVTAGNNLVRVEGEGTKRVFHCKECNYKSKRIKDIQTHIVIHNGERPFECPMCPNRYTQQSSLQAHMEAAHQKYKVEVTCHFCGKYIKGRTAVYRHLKSHSEAKFPCPVCKKLLSKKSFKPHMQRHSGVKSYTCEKCAKSFYTLGELCNHRRWVHNKQKDAYKCDLCGYSASRSDSVKRHKSKHTDTNFACCVCGMFFITVQKLQAHQRQHYEEKKFSCPDCDIKFYRRDSLGKHIQKKHRCTLVSKEELKTPVVVKVEGVQLNDFVIEIAP